MAGERCEMSGDDLEVITYCVVTQPKLWDRQGDTSHPPSTLLRLLLGQAGCSTVPSPGFVLVGVNLHLVSHAKEPEIRKILFQLQEEKKENKIDKEGPGLIPSHGKIQANIYCNLIKLVQPEPLRAQIN